MVVSIVIVDAYLNFNNLSCGNNYLNLEKKSIFEFKNSYIQWKKKIKKI